MESLSIFFAGMLCLSAIGNSYQVVNFTKNTIDKSAGLYYEPMHQIRFTEAEWRLVTFIDMKKFEEQRPVFSENMMQSVGAICGENLGFSTCSNILDAEYIKSKYAIADKYLQQIHAFMSVENESFEGIFTTIKRSAPFGFIGSISESLFGTLDAEDAEYFNGEVEKLYKDQKKIAHSLEKEAYLVKSEFHRFHDEIDTVKNSTTRAFQETTKTNKN